MVGHEALGVIKGGTALEAGENFLAWKMTQNLGYKPFRLGPEGFGLGLCFFLRSLSPVLCLPFETGTCSGGVHRR